MKRLVLAIGRRPRLALILILLASSAALAGLPRVTFDSSLASLTVPDDPTRVFNEKIRAQFGDEEIGVVAVTAPDVYEPAVVEGLVRLTEDLSRVTGVSRTLSITNASDPPADVFNPPPLLAPGPVTAPAAARLRARVVANPIYVPNLVNADGTAAAVAVFFKRAATTEDEAAVDQNILDLLSTYDGAGELYYTGMSHIRVQAISLMRQDLAFFLPLSLALMTVVLWICFRSLRATLLPLFTLTFGVACLLGVMGWLGEPITLTTLVLPSLLLVIGGSYSVHVVATYLLDEETRAAEAGEDSVEVSSEERLASVLGSVGLPVLVSALTTAVGFGSLAIHPIPAIAGLGKYAVLGIAMVAVGSLLGVPLTFLSVGGLRRSVRGATGAEQKGLLPALDGLIMAAGTMAIDHRRTVILAAATVVAVSTLGALEIKSDTDFLRAFRKSSEVRQTYDTVTERLVGPSPVSVIVTAPEAGYFKAVAPLRRIRDLQNFMESIDGVHTSISLVDYFDELDLGLQAAPGGIDVDADGNLVDLPPPPSFWDDPEEQLPQILHLVSASPRTFSGLVDKEFRRLNITLRTSLTGSRETAELRRQVKAYGAVIFPLGVSVELTGSLVIMSEASDRIISGQIESVGLAFSVILAALALMFLSLRVGLAAMIPNVLPIVVFFGVMGWLGIELNLATSVIGAVALGISVDDTIHYMARLNRMVKVSPTQRDALLRTLAAVGRPVVATSITLTAGFLVMGLSGFAIITAFGLLAALTMMTALVTNIMLLPAILATVPVVSVWDLVAYRLGPSPHLTIPLFRGLGRFAVRLIVLLGRLRKFEEGSHIVRRGEPGEEMYLVLEGGAEVRLVDGNVVPLSRGGIVGEMALLRQSPRANDVVATTAVEALVIDQDFLRRLRIRYPRVASLFFINIARILSDRLEAANRRKAD